MTPLKTTSYPDDKGNLSLLEAHHLLMKWGLRSNPTAYCANQLQLITASVKMPIVPLDPTKSADSCFALIEQTTGLDPCNHYVSFAWSYDLVTHQNTFTIPKLPLQLVATKFCMEKARPIFCGLNLDIDILLNSRGELLVEGELASNDALVTLIPKEYFDANWPLIEKPNYSQIILVWDKTVKADQIEAVIPYIIKGYLATANRFAVEQFDQDLCDLTYSQVIKIKEAMPFRLMLDFEKASIRPIMPPPKAMNGDPALY